MLDCIYHYHPRSNSIEQNNSTCFDIILDIPRIRKDKNTWEFGPCFSSHDNDQFSSLNRRSYTEKCCVPNGDYALSCKSKKSTGWVRSFVKIGRHQFCDDYTGYNSFVALNIPGMPLHISYTYPIVSFRDINYSVKLLKIHFSTCSLDSNKVS